jgi:hypothetical protein
MSLLKHLGRKVAPFLFATGLTTSLLGGCSEYKYSSLLHEKAIVTDKRHIDTHLSPIPTGKSIILMPTPEVNQIKFDGEIDFEINNRDIYNKLDKGDLVNLYYKEKYNIKFLPFKEKKVRKIELIGYEFIDAQPIKR